MVESGEYDDLLPVGIDVYEVDGEVNYAGIWVENVHELDWERDLEIDPDNLTVEISNRRFDGYIHRQRN